jgi:RNA polymerase sigma factor (sigma-70 family)
MNTYTIPGSSHVYRRRLTSLASRAHKKSFRNALPDTLPHREKYFWEWFAKSRKADLDILTKRQKEIFLLRYEKKCSAVQVAEILGISKQAVHEHLRASYEKLRKVLYSSNHM